MDQTTQDVITFLNFPDLDYGASPTDAEMLQDPGLLRDMVARLVEGPFPSPESRAAAENLRGRLGEADWEEVSRTQQGRIGIASGFFDPVEENIHQATQ